MRTVRRIQAFLGDRQPLDGPSMQQMLPHNLVHIFRLYKAIPDRVRINDHRGPVLALVQATGFVCAYCGFSPAFLILSLKMACSSPLPSLVHEGRALPGSLILVQINTCRSNLAKIFVLFVHPTICKLSRFSTLAF